ncbi:MAG TPA: hydrogenase iron-sulfur subunit [Dehalococcoidales bacterium]|nr:hydrogenase iron-sulfur subunit [Dehalococcoidales bacterium]
MVTETRTSVRYNSAPIWEKIAPKAKITVFHCFNALAGVDLPENPDYEIQCLKLPCSGMTREVVFLRAFEAGADAVLVMVCPVGSCHYLQGNLRTAKRVARVKKIMDEIGIDGRRLNLFNISHGDRLTAKRIIDQALAEIAVMGPNPAN